MTVKHVLFVKRSSSRDVYDMCKALRSMAESMLRCAARWNDYCGIPRKAHTSRVSQRLFPDSAHQCRSEVMQSKAQPCNPIQLFVSSLASARANKKFAKRRGRTRRSENLLSTTPHPVMQDVTNVHTVAAAKRVDRCGGGVAGGAQTAQLPH